LAILAALALLAALLTGYTLRAVADSDQFAKRAAAALDNDAVRAELSKRVADQIVTAEPDLIAVRPVLEGVVSGIAGTGAFQSLFQAAVADLHRAVFKRDENTIAFTLADIGATIRGTLEAIQPKLASKIPPGIETTVVDADPPAVVVGVVRFADEARWLPWVLLVIGLGSGLGSILLAADSRRAGLRLGIAIALVAVLTLVGMRALRAVLLTTIDDQGARDAGAGLWDVYLGDLRTALLIFAGCGAVVAAAASSLLRPIEITDELHRAWAFVTARPEGRAWRFGRALLLLAAGILIVVRNGEFVSLAATAIGLYVAYVGVSELMRLSLADPRQAAEDQQRGRAVLIATTLTAALILAAALIFIGVGGVSERSHAIETQGCNGSQELCDRTVDTVAFPATHNAMSAASNPGWLFAQQDKGFPDQLHDGIRGLLIDAHYGVETQDGTIKTDLSVLTSGERATYEDELGADVLNAALRTRDRIVNSAEVGQRGVYLCHRFCELGAITIDEAFGDYRDFLAANADEVLVIDIEDYVEPADIAAAAQRTGLDQYIYTGPVGPPWPTLQQMIDSGGRVLMLAEHEGGGKAIPWYHPAYKALLQETPYSFSSPAELIKPKNLDASCEPNRGPADASLFLINHWIDTSPAPKPSNAEKVNTRAAILDRVHHCERQRDLVANLIAVDFYGRGDLFGAVAQLNAERTSTSAAP
jgi:hypothetical protein